MLKLVSAAPPPPRVNRVSYEEARRVIAASRELPARFAHLAQMHD